MFNLPSWAPDAIENPQFDKLGPLPGIGQKTTWRHYVPDDVRELWWDLEWDAKCAVLLTAVQATRIAEENQWQT